MVARLRVIPPADIDEDVLWRNGTGTITVRPQNIEDDDGAIMPAYAVSADFFLAGTDQRNFRTFDDAVRFVSSLVIAVERAVRRSRIKRSTIEIQLEISDSL